MKNLLIVLSLLLVAPTAVQAETAKEACEAARVASQNTSQYLDMRLSMIMPWDIGEWNQQSYDSAIFVEQAAHTVHGDGLVKWASAPFNLPNDPAWTEAKNDFVTAKNLFDGAHNHLDNGLFWPLSP